MPSIRGKSLNAILQDISEGYIAVNPIFLKPIDPETIKELYGMISKIQAGIRAEKFPHKDAAAIRLRNLKLQRLHSAAMIIRNFARERRITLA